MSILDNTAKWAKVSILLLPIAIGFMTASLARKLETPPSHDPEVLKLISTDELIGVARHSRRAVGDEYIIMFGDPFCPACAGAIKDVIRKGLPNITFVYRHYPLESHPDSLMASVRLETLSNDSFWLALAEVHDKKASVLREVEEIAREYDSGSSISPEVARRLVESDYRVAKALRLPGTPFFVYLNRRTGLKRVLWLGEFRRDYLE